LINETDYNNNPLTKEQESQIDALFSRYNNTNTPGCAVGVIKDSRFVYKKCFGMANLDYGIPITADSRFELASVSKQFTAACIMLLISEGCIQVDDNIRKYLPEMPEYKAIIKIYHLLNHTGGVRNYLTILNQENYLFAGTVRDNYINNQVIYKIITEQKELDFLPGEQFSYSISGYLLLAEIVKRVTGQTLSQFASERIFQPLSMRNTLIDDNCKQIINNRVVSYNAINDQTFSYYPHISEDVGSKGVVSSLDDLLRWNENFYNGKVIKPDFVRTMTTKNKLNNGSEIAYGCGFEIYDSPDQSSYGHGGKWLGFRTQMMRFPAQSMTVIVLANRGDIMATATAKEIGGIMVCNFS